jgi:hypothetical protein
MHMFVTSLQNTNIKYYISTFNCFKTNETWGPITEWCLWSCAVMQTLYASSQDTVKTIGITHILHLWLHIKGKVSFQACIYFVWSLFVSIKKVHLLFLTFKSYEGSKQKYTQNHALSSHEINVSQNVKENTTDWYVFHQTTVSISQNRKWICSFTDWGQHRFYIKRI